MSDHQRWAENMQRWEDGMMSVRDQFAAAALTVVMEVCPSTEAEWSGLKASCCREAYKWADAMLRERQSDTKSEVWLNYNANDYVRVRLTDYGRAILKNQHEKLNDSATYLPYTPPVEDSDGWSKWQLHRLMSDFGAHTVMGLPLCFETTIQFDSTRTTHDAAPAARATTKPGGLNSGSASGTSGEQSPVTTRDCGTGDTFDRDVEPAAKAHSSGENGVRPDSHGTGTTLLTESERLAIYTAAEWLSKLARSAAPERASQLFDNATTLLGLAGRMS